MLQASIKRLPANPALEGLARLTPNLVFSRATGTELKLQLLSPWAEGRFPLLVFLQGSGWRFPDVNYELPQLAEYARQGYVVASITHRSYAEGNASPAFLQDAKTAIRYLRANAALFGIDPGRVCFWGSSSGGNTALLVALTGDDPRYKTAEYAQESDAVQLAVECFGPTDLPALFARLLAERSNELEGWERFCGGDTPEERRRVLEEISPLHRLNAGARPSCPLLLVHGDADELVPFDQCERMAAALWAAGCEAEMIRVEGAAHEGNFWSRALHREIMEYLGRKL